ncbi:hypothetical protein AURDEDRAFT_146291 [Auricularia subglabra TFB-10046 SS5]|uniref:Uncharacterized protein n=1 Tax=Auricularia subglabra (strain TFB-10046 / SS5) TaxID=717982 RepID=J0LJW0_AURST|nr:hypothetical protein AURDEDRAFT_146291 [Auricularia subglabra TFB-10046 SS5]
MGYQYEPLRVEPIDEREVELIVGRRPERSLARKVIRCALTVGLALVLLHAYRGGVSRHQAVELMLDGEGHSPWINPAERGELVKCFREEASEEKHLNHPEDHDHKHHELKFVTLPEFTLDGDSLYFFADPPPEERRHEHRGATYGEVVFAVSDESDEITVNAKIGYRRRIISDVCTFKREDGSVGVGVVIPDADDDHHGGHDHEHEDPDHPHHPHHPHGPHHGGRRHHRENNRVKLVVQFPTSKAPLHLKGLETHMPLYRHAFGDLGERVQIDSLDLRSANAPIEAGSVLAKTAEVKTVNSIISGSFNATNSLTITSANAPIDVKIGFVSSLKEDEGAATLTLRTANADIKAVIDLSTSGDDFAGDFLVETFTANAPLALQILSLPSGGKLGLSGKTANAPANVVLPTSYEGVFRLSTLFFKPELVTRGDVEDPASRGRKRTVELRKWAPSGVDGEVYWGEKDDETPSGWVELETKLAPVSLTV